MRSCCVEELLYPRTNRTREYPPDLLEDTRRGNLGGIRGVPEKEDESRGEFVSAPDAASPPTRKVLHGSSAGRCQRIVT